MDEQSSISCAPGSAQHEFVDHTCTKSAEEPFFHAETQVTSFGGPVAHLGYFRPKIVMSIALAPPHLLRVFDVV